MPRLKQEIDLDLLNGVVDTDELYLVWCEVPWDTAVFGSPVLQISDIKIRGQGAYSDIKRFELAREGSGARLISCRLSHEYLRESMFLEDIGFRFIEMLYQPELIFSDSIGSPNYRHLTVAPAVAKDLPLILDIAGVAFRNERFQLDPRLPSPLGDQRYQNWVRGILSDSRQRLFILREGEAITSFFITEMLADGTCYWHLNAIAPEFQGKGYGRRAWLTMMAEAKKEGATRVRSSIVARNYRVLNLYAKLGFSFPPPLMTFHWVRS